MADTETSDPVEALAGVPEGTVLPDGEKVVATRDEEGNIVGWHKEPAGE